MRERPGNGRAPAWPKPSRLELLADDAGLAPEGLREWLRRWLEETGAATIDDATMVAGCLAALGRSGHDAALAALRDKSRRASSARM
jgi:hypothetical protein